VPLFAALLAVMAATVVIYVLRRRRPRVKRQVVEVRLKPWSNNTPVAGSVSLVDEEPVPPPAPEPVERPGGKLIIVDGPDAGREYPVGMSPLSIGSASWCDITFPDPDERLGPEEARAWVHQDKLIFHKLTRLSLLASDGAVGGWLVLENGDEVNVGHFRLRFISLAHTAAEQDVLNRAVNEAVQHLAGRASGGGVASRLWPVHDLPPQAPQAEEMGPQLAPFEIVPVDNPPVEAPESREENPEPARPRLWPVDDPPVDLAESEDVANQPDPFELWPVDDSSGEPQGREEDSDHPAAASV
jgi:predicted component of type VI protein secretion system